MSAGNVIGSNKRSIVRPKRMHHAAWVTRDQEMTRAFYEDVVGLPLAACWIEKNPVNDREYCHTCFELEDGGAIAFFDWADQRTAPLPTEGPGHLALACDFETQAVIKARLEAAGYATRLTDHGYCLSLYVTDPNNYRLEFAVDKPEAAQDVAANRESARDQLRRWVDGDHSVNNLQRSRNP
jgi:catechol 2,3-dioxygenase-like lactoylglutathione lyase family enzyme